MGFSNNKKRSENNTIKIFLRELCEDKLKFKNCTRLSIPRWSIV